MHFGFLCSRCASRPALRPCFFVALFVCFRSSDLEWLACASFVLFISLRPEWRASKSTVNSQKQGGLLLDRLVLVAAISYSQVTMTMRPSAGGLYALRLVVRGAGGAAAGAFAAALAGGCAGEGNAMTTTRHLCKRSPKSKEETMTGRDETRRDETRRRGARQGETTRHETKRVQARRHEKTRHATTHPRRGRRPPPSSAHEETMTGRDETRRRETRRDDTRQGETTRDDTRRDETTRDDTRRREKTRDETR